MADPTYRLKIAGKFVPSEDIVGISIRRRLASVFDRLRIGEASIILDNQSGDYSVENLSGPYSLTAAQSIQISAEDDTTSYFLFTGNVDRYLTRASLPRRQVVIEASDVSKLLRRDIQLALKVDTKIASLFVDVLSASGIQDTAIDAITQKVSFADLDKRTGGDAINELLLAGAHFAFVTGAGKFTAKDRNFDVLSAGTVASYTEFGTLQYTLADDAVINDAIIRSEPRAVRTTVATVSFLDAQPSIPGSASISFFMEFVDPDTLERDTPVASLETPVSSQDFRTNDRADGTGADRTSTASLVVTAFARQAIIDVTNTHSEAVFLSHMQLRGFPITRQPIFAFRSQVSSSQDKFDRKTFEVETELIRDPLFGQAYADFITLNWHDPRGGVQFTLVSQFPDVLSRELLDRVTLVQSHLRVNSDYIIHEITHSIRPGVEHQTRYVGVLPPSKQYLILDDPVKGKLDDENLLGF